MKRIKQSLFVVIVAATLSFVACGSAEQRKIDGLEKLVVDVEASGTNYSQNDWKRSVERFEDIIDDLKERSHNLTPEQNREIGGLVARYHKALITSQLTNLSEDLDVAIQQMSGYYESPSNDVRNNVLINQSAVDSAKRYAEMLDEIFDD